jgi:hypothetical protein
VSIKGKLDPNITTATPQFTCTGNFSDIAGVPSAPAVLFGQINVSLTFAESGTPPGWQEMKVKTYEMRGALGPPERASPTALTVRNRSQAGKPPERTLDLAPADVSIGSGAGMRTGPPGWRK